MSIKGCPGFPCYALRCAERLCLSGACSIKTLLRPSLVSPFLKGDAILMGRTSPMVTFGVAVSHLVWALDWIDLGRMPWNHIIANDLGYTDFHETDGA